MSVELGFFTENEGGFVLILCGKSTLFSTFSLSRYVEIGHRQSRPVDECSEEERGGFG